MYKLATAILILSAGISSAPADAKPDTRGPDVDLVTACSSGSVAVCVTATRGECQQIIAHVKLNGGPTDEEWILREPGCVKLGSGAWQVEFDTDRGTNTGGGDIG